MSEYPIEAKKCVLCLVTRPSSDFQQYSHKTKSGKEAIRLKPRCNACMDLYQPRTPREKTCIVCRVRKPADEFFQYPYRTTQGKSGIRLESRCKVCMRVRYRERAERWAGKYPEKERECQARYRAKPETRVHRRNHYLTIRYGVTLEQYESDYQKQQGKCQICEQHFEKLGVDHCHTTGKYRGLLCDACNQAIGSLRDSPELCEKAANYLRRSK